MPIETHLPSTGQKRIVIAGAGFGGLKLAHELADSAFQVVLIDKFNYHQFQPLLYQVATSGLEPSAIVFPLRKAFQGKDNIHIRLGEIKAVIPSENCIDSSIGKLHYDYLVLAIGTNTNYFGNEHIMRYARPMKSVSEAIDIRNTILQNYELALDCEDPAEQEALMNIVVVGGGPTGVEVSGTLAEMKRHILPKDFPELNFDTMKVTLVEASKKVLATMSPAASAKATEYLQKLKVNLLLNTGVSDYDGRNVTLTNGTILPSKILIWAAGVTGNKIEGLPADVVLRNNRIKVDKHCKVEGSENIFAIGDIACMIDKDHPAGHPQMAQPAIQQAKMLAANFKNMLNGKPLTDFKYKDRGALATVGKNLAVADLPSVKFHGFFAWIVWMMVHLMSIVGVKNRLFIFINWTWSYLTYDQSYRLIIHSKKEEPSSK